MGEDIPATLDYEIGANCLACYAAGETPKYIYVKFVGVTLCPGKAWPGDINLNTTWKLTQTTPCQWEFIDANWDISWENFLPGPWTTCIAKNVPVGQRYFSSPRLAICSTYLPNSYANCPANPWGLSYGGVADMSIYE